MLLEMNGQCHEWVRKSAESKTSNGSLAAAAAASSFLLLLQLLGEDGQDMTKGNNTRTARWERCIQQGIGKRLGAPMPSPDTALSPDLYVVTNLEASTFLIS